MKYLNPITCLTPVLFAVGLMSSSIASAEDCTVTEFIPEDLSFSSSCVEYKGTRYSVTLKSEIRQAEHGWNLSTVANSSCRSLEQNCIIVDDDLRLVLRDVDNFNINQLGRENLNPEDNGKLTTIILEFHPDVLGEMRWKFLGHHRTVVNQTIDSMVDLPQWFRDDMTEREVDFELANHDKNR